MLKHLLYIDEVITLWCNGSNSLFLDVFAMHATSTLTWMPLSLVMIYVLLRNNDLNRFFTLLLCVALCILVADQVASSLFKPLVARFRPAQDPRIMHVVDVVNGYRGGRYGFFSSHASNTFAVATFLALQIRNRVFAYTVFAWAVLNCWTRIYLGVHYLGDILAGALFGALVGYVAYRLYRPKMQPARDMTSCTSMTSTGYAMADLRLVTLTFVLTLLLIAIPYTVVY